MSDFQQAIDLTNSFVSIAHQLKKISIQTATKLGITFQQLIILNSIRNNEGLTQKDLTERLRTAKSRVSLSIDELEKKNYVKRETSANDRRETQLFLTPDGIRLCQRYREESEAYKSLANSLEQFSEDELNILIDMQKKILTDLLNEQTNCSK
ncbi:MarR family winged helix-turn-helix transcriptional regulator [Gottfriedia acidiceleris]|uniref:MarR family winged helix-turn-helix transcriptional regulator n=1 Tax=Gottfriedia acidiceleris TaxID=371036 RepID=UPI0014319F4E|nr:MarR family transcriptional regulator [Gottfriedia acidiceleris]